MSNRLEMCSVSTFAHNLSQEANLVYWLSNSPVDLEGAAYHERAVHEEFRKLSEALGYRVEKIEPVEPITGTSPASLERSHGLTPVAAE